MKKLNLVTRGGHRAKIAMVAITVSAVDLGLGEGGVLGRCAWLHPGCLGVAAARASARVLFIDREQS